MFELGEFTAASGQMLPYKIECENLKLPDLNCVANMLRPQLQPYSKVVGISSVGIQLADFFEQWKTKGSRNLLVVDDVWVTGHSMRSTVERYMNYKRKGKLLYEDWEGVVIFARSRPSIKVRPFMLALY